MNIEKMDLAIQFVHRNVKKEELTADIKSVANKLGAEWITTTEYKKNGGQYSVNTIIKRFKGWNNAVTSAGFSIKNRKNKKHFYCPSVQALLDDIQQICTKLGKTTITSTEYERYGRYGISCARNKVGTWKEVLQKAGLEATMYNNAGISDDELLNEFEAAFIRLKRQPKSKDGRNGNLKYGTTTYINRFGSWTNTLKRFIEYINQSQDGHTIKIADSANNDITPIYHTTTRNICERMKQLVMIRDKATCQICKNNEKTSPNIRLEIDHWFPYSLGGETTFQNLRVLCQRCNKAKGNRILTDEDVQEMRKLFQEENKTTS